MFASVLWGVGRKKRQVRSVTYRACRLEPGCETQYIALNVRVIQELTCCCNVSRNDSVFLHLTALTFHLIAHYLTIQARQSRAGCTHACSFFAGHICSKHIWSSHQRFVSFLCPFTYRPVATLEHSGYIALQYGRIYTLQVHLYTYTVIPRLTKIIRSGITFVSRNVISRRFLYKIV